MALIIGIPKEKVQVQKHLQSLVGSLNFLIQVNILYLANIKKIISQNQHNSPPGHVSADKYVFRYLKTQNHL